VKPNLVSIETFFAAHPELHPELVARALAASRPVFDRLQAEAWPLAAKESIDTVEAIHLANARLGVSVASVDVRSLAELRLDPGSFKKLDLDIDDVDVQVVQRGLLARLDKSVPEDLLPEFATALEGVMPKRLDLDPDDYLATMPECVRRNAVVMALLAVTLILAAATGDAEEFDDLEPLLHACARCCFLGTYHDAPGTLVLLAA
jgi:hypothetical protein